MNTTSKLSCHHLLHTLMRYFLTACFFSILVCFLNEICLLIESVLIYRETPTITELISTIFLCIFSPFAFGKPAFFAGLVFALLVSLFRYKTIACLSTPIIGALATGYFMGQFSYFNSGIEHHLSDTMIHLSIINSAVITLVLACLASTIFKHIFIPIHAPRKTHKKSHSNKFLLTNVLRYIISKCTHIQKLLFIHNN